MVDQPTADESRLADEPICVHCRDGVMFDVTIKDEWTHLYGGTYCRDRSDFTATPLRVATPTFYPKGAVL